MKFITTIKKFPMSRMGVTLKKNAPVLMAIGAGVGYIATVVTTYKKATKASQIKAKYEEELKEADVMLNSDEYTGEDYKKDIRIARTHLVVDYAKCFAVPTALCLTSTGLLLGSVHVFKKSLKAATAATMAVSEAFRRYRQNVIQTFGPDVDRNMRYELIPEHVKEKIVDPETGKTKTVSKDILKEKEDKAPWFSDYSRVFEKGCKCWTCDGQNNLMFLRAIQESFMARMRLRNVNGRVGYLFLNEVYDELGMPQTEAGSILGWIYDGKNGNPIGDNCIDFGLANPHFVNPSDIRIDFNVDGPIKERIGWAKV